MGSLRSRSCSRSRSRRRWSAAALGLVVAAAGCSSGSDSAEVTTAPASVVETTAAPETTAPPGTAPADTVADGAAGTAPVESAADPAAGAPIELTEEGVAGMAFGTDADTVIATLTAALGAPAADSGWSAGQSPCEGMGSRVRNVSWGVLDIFLATGPTVMIDAPTDHFSGYRVSSQATGGDGGPGPDRFVLSDGDAAIGRTFDQVTAWSPEAKRFDSEIEGPIWTAREGSRMVGSFESPADGGAERTASVRSGLFCID